MDNVIPKVKGEAFAKNAQEMDKLNKFMDEKNKLALKEFNRLHPELASKFGYNLRGNAYLKREGSSAILPKLMQCLVRKGGADRTLKDITEEVRTLLPNQDIQMNIWHNELKGWRIKLVQRQINGNMAKPVDIKGCKTLSDVKKKLKSATHVGEADFSVKVKIAIDSEQVVIGKNSYPIQKRKAGGGKYEYPSIRIARQWLRVDSLREALA